MNDHDDRDLRALLREHAPEPPVDEVDWSALHAGVIDRARPLLRRPAPWWQLVAAGSTRSIPAAAAAALAAVLLLVGNVVTRPEPAGVTAAATEFQVIEEELAGGMPAASLALLTDDGDDLLDALMFYDVEEW